MLEDFITRHTDIFVGKDNECHSPASWANYLSQDPNVADRYDDWGLVRNLFFLAQEVLEEDK